MLPLLFIRNASTKQTASAGIFSDSRSVWHIARNNGRRRREALRGCRQQAAHLQLLSKKNYFHCVLLLAGSGHVQHNLMPLLLTERWKRDNYWCFLVLILKFCCSQILTSTIKILSGNFSANNSSKSGTNLKVYNLNIRILFINHMYQLSILPDIKLDLALFFLNSSLMNVVSTLQLCCEQCSKTQISMAIIN